ncbi:ribose 5-phosphate isomerase B [bacterium]|nr:ribose 5-phosphate isomerase B [bacterium]
MTHPILFIASDHGGLGLKEAIVQRLSGHIKFVNLGTQTDQSVDYPDFADILCNKVLATDNGRGILICGTGIGISIRANRHPGIRAALVASEFMAEMAKAHNNANVLCLGGRTTDEDSATRYIERWLKTEFEGGRHQRRVEQLDRPL